MMMSNLNNFIIFKIFLKLNFIKFYKNRIIFKYSLNNYNNKQCLKKELFKILNKIIIK